MKRALLSQMAHEWKTNIWFVIELVIVTYAILFLLLLLWSISKGIFDPRGFSPDNVYSIDVRGVSESSPYYLPEYEENFLEDREELIRRLKENPNVEYVSLHNNFLPYQLSWIGSGIRFEGPDSIIYSGNFRYAEPDIIKLLDIRSVTGKSQDELVAILERGEILISPDADFEEVNGPIEKFAGKTVYVHGQEENRTKIGDIVYSIKREDFQNAPNSVILPLQGNSRWNNIILKVKPGRDKAFEEDFYSDYDLTHLRNVYFTNLKSLVKMGESLNMETNIKIRLIIGISTFFLITIFLGLLGSFWFRVQQRVSEIAIRKTFGATNKELFQRIIGEGLLLLVGAIIIASACIWPFIGRISEKTGEKWYMFLTVEAITAGLIAIGIILSLWYPAWRAMKIEPAIAVKEE